MKRARIDGISPFSGRMVSLKFKGGGGGVTSADSGIQVNGNTPIIGSAYSTPPSFQKKFHKHR